MSLKYMFATTKTIPQEGGYLKGRDGYPIHADGKVANDWAKVASTSDLDVFGLTASIPYPGHTIETSLNTYQVLHLDNEGDLVLRSELGKYHIVAQEEFEWVACGLGHMSEGVPTWNLSKYMLCTCNCGAMFPRRIDEHGPRACNHNV